MKPLADHSNARPEVGGETQPGTPNSQPLIRTLAITWSIVVALVLVSGLGLFNYFAGAILEDNHKSLLEIATSQKKQVESVLRERFNDGKLLALRAPVIAALEESKLKALPKELRLQLDEAILQTETIFDYREISLYDTEFKRLAADSYGHLQPAEAQALMAALQSKKGVLLDLHLDHNNQPGFGVVQPVFSKGDSGQTVVGLVYMEMDAKLGLYSALSIQSESGKTSMEALLVRREGDEVVYLSPLKFSMNSPALTVKRSMAETKFFPEEKASAD